MTKLFLIKEFSELTAVTVRALHYYDEIGLLKPSNKTASGHRLYSEKDLLRLQQITTLKFLGFSLGVIKEIILNKNFNIHHSLKIQAEMLSLESSRIDKAIKLINYISDKLQTDNPIAWETLTKIIEVMNMSELERNQWEKRFLNTTEMNEFEKMVASRPQAQWDEIHQRWLELLNEIKLNLAHAPDSEIGQALAKKWLVLVEEIYGDYQQLKNKMWEAMKSEAMPKDDFPYDQAVLNYIEKATGIFNKKK